MFLKILFYKIFYGELRKRIVYLVACVVLNKKQKQSD